MKKQKPLKQLTLPTLKVELSVLLPADKQRLINAYMASLECGGCKRQVRVENDDLNIISYWHFVDCGYAVIEQQDQTTTLFCYTEHATQRGKTLYDQYGQDAY